MKIGVISDSHFGARNDNPLFLDYFQEFYDKIFFPYLDEHHITQVLHLGDIMDRRRFCNFNTLSRVRSGFFQPLLNRKTELIVTIGNHDTYYKNKNDVNSPNELFGRYPNVTIYQDPAVLTLGNLDIQLMPWISPANEAHCLEVIRTSRCPVMMGHLELKGFQMYRGLISDHGLDKRLFDQFHMVLSGHYHHRSTTGSIYYLGSPYEITFSDLEDPRGFHILDTETMELEFVLNPHRMFFREVYADKGLEQEAVLEHDYMRLANKFVKVVVASKTNPYLFERYLDRLSMANPADVSIVEEFEVGVTGDDDQEFAADDTLTILNTYVDTIDMDIDKGRLKRVLGELLSGAIAGDDNMGEEE